MTSRIVFMSFKKNLEHLMAQRGLNANSLSEVTDGELAQPTTRRILTGKTDNIRDVTLEKYAKFFGVELGTLKYGDVTVISKQPTSLDNLELWDDETPLNADDIEIPFFKEVCFSAGSGHSQVVEEAGKKLRFSKRTLRNAGIDQEFAACATNYGNSMESTILDGASIGIDRSKQTIKDGKIYAFDHGGMLRVKRLYRLPFGGVRVVSDNQEYKDEVMTAEEWQTDVRLLGWVFWWSVLDKW